MSDAVEVYPLRLNDAPAEVWYGAKVNGRDLQAGWADPDAARRAGERHLGEIRRRISRTTKGGETMETTERKTAETETEIQPDGTQTERTERETERTVQEPEDPKLPDDGNDDEDDAND